MKQNARVILRLIAGILLVGALFILANKLGHLRWFWPNDDAVFAVGLIIGIGAVAVFQTAMAPELERRSDEDQ